MIIFSYLHDLLGGRPETAMTFKNYDEVIAYAKSRCYGNWISDFSIHSEEELMNMTEDQPPEELREMFKDAIRMSHDKGYCEHHHFNKIYPCMKEAIPSDWKKVKYVVGWHREMHLHNFDHGHGDCGTKVWNEKLWTVVGVVASDWPGKEN